MKKFKMKIRYGKELYRTVKNLLPFVRRMMRCMFDIYESNGYLGVSRMVLTLERNTFKEIVNENIKGVEQKID